MNFDNVCSFALDQGCEVIRNAPLSRYTTFRTGGEAAVMIIPQNDVMLAAVLKNLSMNGIDPLILGNGSNMLVSDNGLDTVVINMCRPSSGIRITDDGLIECDAGVTMSKLCNYALEKSLTGLEFAFGIPGTAGGAAFMNAGAYGGEMKDVLVACYHLDRNGEPGMLKGDELELGYRTSAYEKNGYIITKLYLKLAGGSREKIHAEMQELLQRRRDKQPLEYPSAGSTFKRPEGHFAGRLIEECGLKGSSIGGAKVSEKHAGFIINTGGATSSDIIKLIKHVQDTVFREKGVMLEPEVRIIGE